MRSAHLTQAVRWTALPLLAFPLAWAHGATPQPKDSPQKAALVRQQIARQPITFFPAISAKSVTAYESHLPNYDLQVRATGMTIRSQKVVAPAPVSKPAFDGGMGAAAGTPQVAIRQTSVEFLGASPAAQLEALDPGHARVNRFVGKDPSQWQHDLPTYSRVRTRGLYPGVDLVYYGSGQGTLEYDLVVAPHADLKQIRFRSQGDDKAVLERDGSLDLDGKDGSVRLQRPVLYQDDNGSRRAILGNFVQLAPGEFGFQSVDYDHNRPLIVDPTIKLIYATYAGGIHNELEFDMVLDASGNAYVVGESASQDFPVTGNALQTTRQAIGVYAYDAVILKFDASGELLFSTFLGGYNNESANAIAVGTDGSVYVGGQTQSSDFPVTTGAYQKTYGGGQDAFFVKISNDGAQLLYSTYLGAGADETIQSLILNTDGTLWIGGTASGPGLTTSATAFQKTAPGADDYFVAKAQFSQSGAMSLPYLTFLGGSGNGGQELGHIDMVTDTAGNVYVGGGTNSADYPVTTNAYEKPFQTSGGCYNTVLPNTIGTLSKLSPDLSQLLYSTVIGGHQEDQNGYPVCNQFVRTIHLDAQGNIWMIGTTGMIDFPTTSNAMSKQLNGNGLAGVDDFVAEMSADGSKLLYSSYFGGSQFDYGARAAWDQSNHIWIVTTTQSPDYPVTSDAIQTKSLGGYDAGITELSADGTTILYSTYLGGSGDEDLNGSAMIRLDAQGNVRLTGTTYSTDYPVTGTAVQQLLANGDQGPDGSDIYYSVLGTGLIGTVGPLVGGNTGDTTVTVSGAGFTAGAMCQLTLNSAVITAGQVSISPDGTKINCTFSLNGATAGAYDVTVTNPNNGGSFTKLAAFTVQSGGAPNMWVNIVARPKIRTGVPSAVTVTYGNSGTVDAYMSHLVVNTPANIQSTFVAGVPPNLPSGMQVPTTVTQGGLNSARLLLPRVPAGSSGSFQMTITDPTDNDAYHLTASIAKPWFTTAASAQTALTAAANAYTPASTCVSNTAPTNCLGTYLTQLKTAGATAAQTQAIASTMLGTLQQVERYGSTPVIDGGTSLGYVPPTQLVSGTLVISGVVSYDDTLEYHISGIAQQNIIPITKDNCVSYAGNTGDAIGGTLLRCTLTIQVQTGTGIVVAGGSYGSGGALIPSFDTCFTVKQDITAAGFTINAKAGSVFCALNADTGDDVAPKIPDDVIIVIGGFDNTDSSSQSDLLPDGGSGSDSGGGSGGSIDPNGKSGPTGDGSANHYVPASASLSYNVYFENEAKATLPASQVVVTDQLDATKVDLSTLTLGPVTFGTNTLTPPANSTGFAITYAPPGVTSYVVRAQGSIDKNTGLLKWTFTTLDPKTGLPPSDTSLGFLPPDVDGIVGQGSVTYNVMPIAAAQKTDTQIPNFASVVFDANAAIITPTYTNTLDADAPTSSVTTLPSVETITGTATTLTFPVAWSGTDKGAGIKSYTIFVSDNNGAYTPWQSAVTTTTANYTGTAGHTYGFYSIAVDGAGNLQAAKTAADTTTTVSSLGATNSTLSVTPTTGPVGTSVAISVTVAPATGSGTPTGQVTFKDGASTVLGTATLSAGKASLTTTSLALGGHTITAIYAGDGTYAGSTSSSITVTVTAAPPDFSVTLSLANATVKGNGGTTSTVITLAPSGGFTGTVALACSGLPSHSTCTFSPSSLAAGGSPATSTMTISTNTVTASSLFPHESSGMALAFLGGLFGLSFLRGRKRLAQSLAVVCLLLVGWGVTGCGGTSTNTPSGTYAVTVTATSGSTVHSATFNLTVQ